MRNLKTPRLTQRAKEALLESILVGEFPAFLPNEERLAEELGVSRTTVREALRSLEEDGLVSRQRGIGTWVNKHVVQAMSLNRAVGFYDFIREAGYEPEIAWTRTGEAIAEPEITRRLGMAETESPRVLVIERLFLASGKPVIHLTENVPRDEIVRSFTAMEVPDSIFAFSDTFCRVSIDHTVVEIIPTATTAAISAQLPLERGQPLLCLIETHHSSGGRPFIVSVIHVVDQLLRFSVVRKRM